MAYLRPCGSGNRALVGWVGLEVERTRARRDYFARRRDSYSSNRRRLDDCLLRRAAALEELSGAGPSPVLRRRSTGHMAGLDDGQYELALCCSLCSHHRGCQSVCGTTRRDDYLDRKRSSFQCLCAGRD